MIRFSIYPMGRRDNASARHHDWPWPMFAQWLATPVDSDDKEAQLYSPRLVTPESPGGRSHGPASVLLFEYDKDATPELLRAAWSMLQPFDAVVHTSASATPECPRFRAAVRPSRPIESTAEYRSCIDHFGARLGATPVDSLISRGWYRPIRRCSARVIEGGAALDVDACVLAYPPAPVDPDYETQWIVPDDPPAPDFAAWIRYLAPAPVTSTGGRLFSWLVASKRAAWEWAVVPELAWMYLNALLESSHVPEYERRRQFDNIDPGLAVFGSLTRAPTAAEQLARLRGAA